MSEAAAVPHTAIVWLRRDLRLRDNAALFEAARRYDRVCLAFVVDRALLAAPRFGPPLVDAFLSALAALRDDVRPLGSDLALLDGDPAERLTGLAGRIGAKAIFCNDDYEPFAVERDRRAAAIFRDRGIAFETFTDLVYFAPEEISLPAGGAYRTFTPYKRRWLDRRALAPRLPFPSGRAVRDKLVTRDALGAADGVPAASALGFDARAGEPVSERAADRRLSAFLEPDGAAGRYRTDRDRPDLDATSHLSVHLRTGTIGIRTCVERAMRAREGRAPGARAGIDAWIGELVWREFFQMILARFPHVAGGPFAPAAAALAWRDDDEGFEAWAQGRTGYPIVDAAMRELNATGWMHNRLRMIAASFLTKHLLIDWRRGERYFETTLRDADVAQNNGGWQWCASTGTDAAPYFRIFNPTLQARRFDPEGAYVKRILPELRSLPAGAVHEPWRAGGVRGYPAPIVEHAAARARALALFRKDPQARRPT